MTARSEPQIAALSLGGNVGDVAAAFRAALQALNDHRAVCVIARSSVWRTPPWGKTDQPDFLNMAALVETTLSPHDLLTLCLAIEREAGRDRRERWGPRTLDIDIITYGDLVHDDATLTLPHPRARERAFVLVPLAEIAEDTLIGGHTIRELAAQSVRAGMAVDPVATQALSGV